MRRVVRWAPLATVLAALPSVGAAGCSSESRPAKPTPHRHVWASRFELSPRCRAIAWHRIGKDPTEDELRKVGANFVVTYDFTTRAARSYQCPVDWLDLQVGPTQAQVDKPKEKWDAPRPDELAKCDQSRVAEACFDVAVKLEETSSEGRHKVYFEKACDLGLAHGCFVLAQGPEEAKWRERTLVTYERRCRAGDREACQDGAYILKEGKGSPKDPTAAKKRFGL